MKVNRKDFPNWVKCPGCNWSTAVLYSFPGNPIDEEGLCAYCFMDLIVDMEYDVKAEVKP